MASRRELGAGTATAILSSIFFAWGAITCLNDVLIPHLKAVFAMNYARSMLVQLTFFSTYCVVSLPAGRLVARIGFQRGIVVGLLIAGVGALGFLPAAGASSYPLFLAALFVLASGITLLQVAANPYISLLGDERSASSRLTLAQALNSLGTTLAPALVGPLILAVAVLPEAQLARLPAAAQEAYRAAQAHSVQLPYLGIALALLALAVAIAALRLPRPGAGADPAGAQPPAADPARSGLRAALAHRNLRLGVVAIFVYVGAEVAIGSLLINYLSDARIGNVTESQATRYVSYYWGGAMVGRFVGAALLRRIDPGALVAVFALGAIALLATTVTGTGPVAMWSVIAVGLANSIMFPTLFTLGIAGLGALTSAGSSLMIMAIVGGAVVPYLMGLLADSIGLQRAYALPIACYAYIAWYAWRGARTADV